MKTKLDTMKESIQEKSHLNFSTEMVLDNEDLLDEIIAFRFGILNNTLIRPAK